MSKKNNNNNNNNNNNIKVQLKKLRTVGYLLKILFNIYCAKKGRILKEQEAKRLLSLLGVKTFSLKFRF